MTVEFVKLCWEKPSAVRPEEQTRQKRMQTAKVTMCPSLIGENAPITNVLTLLLSDKLGNSREAIV